MRLVPGSGFRDPVSGGNHIWLACGGDRIPDPGQTDPDL